MSSMRNVISGALRISPVIAILKMNINQFAKRR
jgi:hypothetical protein